MSDSLANTFAIFSQLVSNEMTLLDKIIFALVASVIDFLWYTLVSFMVGNSSVRNILNKGTYLSLASSIIFVFLSLFILIKIIEFIIIIDINKMNDMKIILKELLL